MVLHSAVAISDSYAGDLADFRPEGGHFEKLPAGK